MIKLEREGNSFVIPRCSKNDMNSCTNYMSYELVLPNSYAIL